MTHKERREVYLKAVRGDLISMTNKGTDPHLSWRKTMISRADTQIRAKDRYLSRLAFGDNTLEQVTNTKKGISILLLKPFVSGYDR
jgi:hypothetical protein